MRETSPEHSASLFLSAALAFAGGYTDAATYVGSTVFAGHISGNCVLLAISIVMLRWHDAAIRAGAVVFSVAGIGASALLDLSWVQRTRIRPIPVGLLAEAILFLIPGIATAARHPVPTVWSVLLLCIALGLQTGTLRRTNGVSVYTAFVAGMITRLTEGETRALEQKPGPPGEDLRVLAILVFVFLFGAVVGTAVAIHAPRWTFLAMGLLLLFLTMLHASRLPHADAGARRPSRAPEEAG